jgi:hypothetical protein
MKKAKIMLLSVGVVAVVGGALAFKAKKFNGEYFCAAVSTAKAGSALCTDNQNDAYTTVAGANPSFSSFCTIFQSETCGVRTFVTPNE